MYLVNELSDLSTRHYDWAASRELTALSDVALRDIGLRRDELGWLGMRASGDSLRQAFARLFARRPVPPVLGVPARA